MGKIHSIETMGLVDGPGIRVVVFFQGCRLRCAFCHNPDTWDFNGGTMELSPDELLDKVKRFKTYFKASGGGVTCSGGEPLMQPEFLLEFFKLCKENGINTTLDTAGFGKGNYKEILNYTDTVILDIKHVDKNGYKKLTGGDMDEFYKFLQAVNEAKSSIWIRHVMVPGITDNYKAMDNLIDVIRELRDIEKFEVLPYHTLGVKKYDKLDIRYRLKDTEPMDKEAALKFESYVKQSLKNKS
ncbi:pyruvate formate-lyase-activating protein [Clostridium neuense]|uniref:Pyruvate formate-lyase-activating enzyme n=1 Tax=Clostridium neuense TaxID=1728934 RepID=A0ABW8TIW7_9CLOT